MEVRVSPTRMHLLRTRRRLAMAVRGHKLLKDKRDELMKKFLALVRRNKELREEVEGKLGKAFKSFLMARAVMPPEVIEEAIMYPKRTLEFDATSVNVLSVKVPKFSWAERGEAQESEIYPYGLAATASELDFAIGSLAGVLPRMVELAEVEKSVELLSAEIEKTRRRVNALEYVLIPQLEETARYITMKLDEMERGNLTRLMKVKEIVRERGA
ncbi:MAG: V-type ATP synthase subunit D [Firmicutes bacterium]|nr:V-type ATP synthase subunit D [Bacillota bacterium]